MARIYPMISKDHDTWCRIYDKLQYSTPAQAEDVWQEHLLDINFLRRNNRRYYDHLIVTKEIISDDPSNPITLVV